MIPQILTAVALLAAASPVLAAPTTILPGYWESTSKATLLTESAPKVEKRCLTPGDQVDAYLTGPSTRRYTCVYSSTNVHGGVASFKGRMHRQARTGLQRGDARNLCARELPHGCGADHSEPSDHGLGHDGRPPPQRDLPHSLSGPRVLRRRETGRAG